MITAEYTILSSTRVITGTCQGEAVSEICLELAHKIRKAQISPDESVSILVGKESIKPFQVPFVAQSLQQYLGGRFSVIHEKEYSFKVLVFREGTVF